MRIIIYSTINSAPWGGSEALWLKVASTLLENGHQVAICTKKWDTVVDPIKKLKSLYSSLIVFDRYHHYSNSILNKIENKIKIKQNEKFLIKQFKKFSPDKILISQGGTFDFYYNNFLLDFIANQNVAFSLISHFNFETPFPLSGDIINNIDKVGFGEHFYFVSSRNHITAERQALRKIQNFKLIGNLPNIDNAKYLKPNENDCLEIGMVARLENRAKGHDLLFTVLSDSIFDNYHFHINLYGTGPDKEYLIKLAAFYNINDKISFKGVETNVDKIWQNNHLLLLTSLAEGTPLVIQEAMRRGRAIVATDVGDCNRFVINDETGILIAGANIGAIKSGLLSILSKSKSDIIEMGINAFELSNEIIDEFPDKTIVHDLLEGK